MKRNIITVLVLLIFNYGCSNSERQLEEDKNQGIPQPPIELQGFSMEQIEQIHQYLNVDRWNNGGDIGKRNGTNYTRIAEGLNIPLSKLEAIDKYYHYDIHPVLEKEMKELFGAHENLRLDYYHAVEATAYCGVNTVKGSITVYGQKAKDNFADNAEKIAVELVQDLPEWVTGYKLNYVTYKDSLLETEGKVDVGFLWVRGNGTVQKRKSSDGLYGYYPPEVNRFWHTREWNDLKKIDYPEVDK